MPLTGCLICVTGLSLETREALKKLIEASGGIYACDLTRSCTQLIADVFYFAFLFSVYR